MKSSDNEEVLFCDNHLLIALKPSDLLTQRDHTSDLSLEDLLKAWVKKTYHKEGAVFLHPIHRLDRAVSGLVLFARSSKALSRLNEQSRNMAIQRHYIAELEGILQLKEGQLDHYLIHGDHRALIGKEGDAEAKHARLRYRVIEDLPYTTRVEIELETGRYHQIRAQFSAIGHPIVGDRKYGAKSGDGKAIRLHGAKLSFTHPVTQEILRFESPPPF